MNEFEEKDGFKADYPSGGDFPNRYTNKTCSITISTTFYCDPDADWNVTSINAPGFPFQLDNHNFIHLLLF